MDLTADVERIALESGFSGVVRIDEGGDVVVARAYGLAHRGLGIANTLDTRFAIASGVKGFTALVIVSLIDEGRLELGTPARHLLADDLPLIADDVTVEHLLAHRSGIGDYLDESVDGAITDYVMPVPVHQLATTEQFLPVLDGYPTAFAAGERFAYCNGGYVVLALLAERAAGETYHDLVRQRVCDPAAMHHTEFLRSDEPDEGVALGYLEEAGLRTNVLHLPVRGVGDGGASTTVADVHSFWAALFESRIVPAQWVAEMVRPRSAGEEDSVRYGLGFWLDATTDAVALEGYDAGISFRSVHQPSRARTFTVISNFSDGAWPLVRALAEKLD
jgi:CubicO group peptidase (beta-lactamase class C family)